MLISLALLAGAMLWSLLVPKPELSPPPEPMIYWVSSTGKVHNETCRFARKFMMKNTTEDCEYCGGKSRNPLWPKKSGRVYPHDILFEKKYARVDRKEEGR